MDNQQDSAESVRQIEQFEPEFDKSDIPHTDVTIESFYDSIYTMANIRRGRGSGTAAGRGYDFQRVAGGLLSQRGSFSFYDNNGWYDVFGKASEEVSFRAESKSCINEYPNGQYGRYEIWKHNHDQLVEHAFKGWHSSPVYVFFTYSASDDQLAHEIGKVVVPAPYIERVINSWHTVDQDSMNGKKRRQISWRLMLKRLGVSVEEFRQKNTVVVTDSEQIDPVS